MKPKQKSNKKSNIKIILSIILCVILIIIIKNLIIKEYNKSFIENYVAKTYPDYTILKKNYEIAEDDFSLDISCLTSLQNRKSGMRITIPFYHFPYQGYKETKYNRKNIKKMAEEYERYWDSINDLKEIYNIELHISDVEITEASNCDIYEMTIYLKYQDDLDVNQIINKINNLNTSLNVLNVNYVIAKEEIYKSLNPWSESNKYYIVPEGMKKTDNDSKFDLYMEMYKKEGMKTENKYVEYYIKKKY